MIATRRPRVPSRNPVLKVAIAVAVLMSIANLAREDSQWGLLWATNALALLAHLRLEERS